MGQAPLRAGHSSAARRLIRLTIAPERTAAGKLPYRHPARDGTIFRFMGYAAQSAVPRPPETLKLRDDLRILAIPTAGVLPLGPPSVQRMYG